MTLRNIRYANLFLKRGVAVHEFYEHNRKLAERCITCQRVVMTQYPFISAVALSA